MIEKFLTNKWLVIFTGYLAFILYGTLLPFRFSLDEMVIARNLDKLLEIFDGSPLYWMHNESDMVANILFFIPFGLFLFNLLAYQEHQRIPFKRVLWIVLVGLFLSITVETCQLFSPRRTSSLLDVLTNTLGAFVGALAGFWLYRRKLLHKLHDLIDAKLQDKTILMIIGYIMAIFIVGLAPFNFNISPGFVSLRLMHLKLIEQSFLHDPVNLFSLIFIYAPGGYIFTRFFSLYLNRPAFGQPMWWALLSGTSLCSLVELGQFFVRSRTFSLSDVLVGILGICYGIITYAFFHQPGKLRENRAQQERHRKLLIFVFINYLIYAGYKFLYPIEAIEQSALIIKKVEFFLFNILSYAPSGSVHVLLKITIKNFILFVPLGMIAKEFGRHYPVFKKRTSLLAGIGAIVVLLKALQLTNSQQLPILFDFFGILIGILSGYYSWNEISDFFIADYHSFTVHREATPGSVTKK